MHTTAPDDLRGFAADVDGPDAGPWPARLVRIALGVLALGVVVGAIVWFAVGTTAGQDVAALIWVLSFAGAIAAGSIRQMLLAERA